MAGRHNRALRAAGAIHPLAPARVFRPDAAVSDAFLASKRDRRLIRRSAFRSRVLEGARVDKAARARRRRRAEAALGCGAMRGLADALPGLGADGEQPREGGARSRVPLHSLRSRPGALRRRETVVRGEMARFGANMARLARRSGDDEDDGSPSQQQPEKQQQPAQQREQQQQQQQQQKRELQQQKPAPDPRWAALRQYIASSMEQAPAFRPTT